MISTALRYVRRKRSMQTGILFNTIQLTKICIIMLCVTYSGSFLYLLLRVGLFILSSINWSARETTLSIIDGSIKIAALEIVQLDV